MAPKKNTFILKNIDIPDLERRYNLQVEPSANDGADKPDAHLTLIDDIYSAHSNTFSFLDETKKFRITMIDSILKKSICCQTCYWCRHGFASVPIGCPIRFVPLSMVKICKSEITKQVFMIEQSIADHVADKIELKKNQHIVDHGYYETEGSFCSFNCALAYINDTRVDTRNSKNLLMKMHTEVFGYASAFTLHPSPSWKLLLEYGGFMTIDDFKSSFQNHYYYIDRKIAITEVPKTHTIGHVYEELYLVLEL